MAFIAPIIAAVGAAAGSAGGIAATALGVAGAVATGISSMSQAKYQQKVANNNYTIALQNAQRESDAAQIEQARSDRDFAQLEAQQAAIQSASGFDVLGASQLRVRDTSQRVRAEQAGDIRRAGEVKVNNYRNDASNFRSESKAAGKQGVGALASMVIGVGSSLIGDARSTKRRR